MDRPADDLACVTFRGAGGAATSAFVPRAAPGGGTPMFLVPGFGLDGRSFAPFAALGAERRVVLWNPPNELPSSPGLDALVAAVIAHADAGELPARFVIGGASLGATLALAATLAHPRRVAGLVLIGGVARYRDLGPPMRLARLLQPLVPRRSFHRIAPRILAPGDPTDDPVLAELRSQMARRTKGYAASVISALTGAGRFDLVPRLGEIRAPTLVIHAHGDRVAPFAAGERLATIAGARLVPVASGSHMPHLTRPGDVIPALREFLAAVDRAEAG